MEARRRRAPAWPVLATAVALALGAGACTGQPATGTGPGGGAYETDARLANHTIFYPADLATRTTPLPIVVWGNGGCALDALSWRSFLAPLAGKGVLAIANGTPNGPGVGAGGAGRTSAAMLTEAIDWAVAENSRAGSKYQGKIDTTKVTAMGQSCGGIEAINAAADPRVGSTILWNSGLLPSGALGSDKAALTKVHGPVAWLNGGPSDIAYQNAIDDYAKVPSTVPAVLGSYGDVGHVGLFTGANAPAAEMATVARNWIDATLYDDTTARAQFVGPDCGLCHGTPWTIRSKNWESPDGDVRQ